MERFPFLELYIRLARVVAAVVAALAVLQAFSAWALGFFAFLATLVTGLLVAFLILVGADVLACFRAIEQNTRKGS
ncbi:MAG: hypothetical protein FJ265_04540 [Planctomycetes bacterium]|nr:hypothetical protein [Planctomycetota bacterium]